MWGEDMDKYIRSVSLIDGHVEGMTETEVIKALECCEVGKDKCRKCPFYCTVPACSRYLAQFALDFINRLQKENKDKDKVIKRLVDQLSIPSAEEVVHEHNGYLECDNNGEKSS